MLKSLAELLYPSKCALCGTLGPESVCGACFSHFERLGDEMFATTAPLDYAWAIFDYTGLAARVVQRLKYERVTSLSAWMAESMFAEAQREGLLNADVVVPVPIHWTRTTYRGFNQAELLCERLPKELVRTRVIRRTRATRPQVGLSHEERTRNLEGAFEVLEPVDGLDVLLVDDVLTSGGTAMECAAVLKKGGAMRVGILTFAAERRWRV